MNRQVLILSVYLFLLSCNNGDDGVNIFPELKNLTTLKQTVFLPTLETNFNTRKNSVYAATLLMAWDEIKKELHEPIIKIGSTELLQMNNSDSYKNVLSENEYETSIEIKDTIVIAKVYFNKSLPFFESLFKDENKLMFSGDSVVSFSFYGYDKAASIAYYKNDNDFALRLFPKNTEHEIILMKSAFQKESNLKYLIEKLIKKESDF